MLVQCKWLTNLWPGSAVHYASLETHRIIAVICCSTLVHHEGPSGHHIWQPTADKHIASGLWLGAAQFHHNRQDLNSVLQVFILVIPSLIRFSVF